MRESRLSGSVRGVLSNGHPYRDPAPEAVNGAVCDEAPVSEPVKTSVPRCSLMFAASRCRHRNSLLARQAVQHGRRWAGQEARS